MAATKKIAICMELNWPYKRHYEPFAGVQEYANTHPDWEVSVSNFPEVEIEDGEKYAGIIGRISEPTMLAAKAHGIPVVNLWMESPVADQLPCVEVDHEMAGRIAAEHLINRGFRQLIHYGYTRGEATKDHKRGMISVAKEHGIPYAAYDTRYQFTDKVQIWQAFIDDLIKIREKFTPPIGFVTANDQLSHAVTTKLLKLGWKSPEDFAVVGTHNDTQICDAVKPSLSSIEMGHRRCGYEAAEFMGQLIESKTTDSLKVIRIPPKELIVRGSSDAYAVDDAVLAEALKFMVLNLQQKISVPDIAAAAGVGRQTLERRFRKHLDRSVNDELIRLRVSKMKRLLVKTDYTVGEISEMVGFGTTVNMNAMFRKFTGTTPLAYKKTHV